MKDIRVRKSIMCFAMGLERALREEEKYCKKEGYTPPRLQPIYPSVTYVVPKEKETSWTNYDGKWKKFVDVHVEKSLQVKP